MRKSNYCKFAVLWAWLALLLTACVKDVYDPTEEPGPKPGPGNEVSEELKDFGFATRGDIKLSVDYNAPGFKGLIEVYSEYPLQENSNLKKEGVKSIYSFYTNENGKYEGTMYIPTVVKEAYLYTDYWGVPQCVTLDLSTKGTAVYKSDFFTKTQAMTKAPESFDKQQIPPYLVMTYANLYSIFKWDVNGKLTNDSYTITTDLGNGDFVANLTERVQKIFTDNIGNNSKFLRDADVVNVVTKEDGTTLDVVFMAERAAHENPLGYYYYKVGNAPKNETELNELKKYTLFPRLNDRMTTTAGQTVRLKFFGEKHDNMTGGTTEFPKGYEIGWFFFSNAYDIYYETISEVFHTRKFYSNSVGDRRRFVALTDVKTKLLILGFEDQVDLNPTSEDYSDALFFIKSNKDITNSERPEIPDETPEEKPAINNLSGTLAFEDIWPNGGDYDMNDVAVEYVRDIKSDGNNMVQSVTETFKYVQRPFSAQLTSYFAYQVDNLGSVTTPSNVTVEGTTNSIVITSSAKESLGEDISFVIERTFNGSVSLDAIRNDFNPYIIVNDVWSSQSRKEVHLPNHKATNLVDKGSIGNGTDAFYMDKNGRYPFAIDIPVLNFELSKEREPIDQTYEKFRSWADSFGTTDTDWYLSGVRPVE